MEWRYTLLDTTDNDHQNKDAMPKIMDKNVLVKI